MFACRSTHSVRKIILSQCSEVIYFRPIITLEYHTCSSWHTDFMICSHACIQTRVHKPVCTKVYQCYATLPTYGQMSGIIFWGRPGQMSGIIYRGGWGRWDALYIVEAALYSQEVRNLINYHSNMALFSDNRECLAYLDNWCSNPNLLHYSPYRGQ